MNLDWEERGGPNPEEWEVIVAKATEGWTPGCYGLERPACLLTCDAVTLRGEGKEAEILLCLRGDGRWQAGLWMVSTGGFVDPSDRKVLAGLEREQEEELGTIRETIEDLPFFVGGPVKLSYRWDPDLRRAMWTGELAQNAPVVTNYHLARWESGEPESTKEVPETRWVRLGDLIKEERTYAFDMGLMLEEVFRIHGLL